MSSYQDKWTRWHDKPTNGIKPSSNNGWIYSSYAKHLLPLSLDRETLHKCYIYCVNNLDPVMIDRSPNQKNPPFSKDETIGCVSLGLLTDSELSNSNYNFCNVSSDFNRKLTLFGFFKAILILWRIRKEHRNYVWQNNLTDSYALAFKLPPEDIYYVKRFYNKNPGILLSIVFYINAMLTIYKGDKSSRMMLWLKVKDLELENTFIGKKVIKKEKEWVRTYFGNNHPFTLKIDDTSK